MSLRTRNWNCGYTLMPKAVRRGRWMAAALLMTVAAAAGAQTRDYLETGEVLKPAPADPAVSAALKSITPQEVRATIEKLVSFQNRNTLSSMEKDLPKGTGARAAADWIESELGSISQSCGGTLEVYHDRFIQPKGTGSPGRVPQDTELTNVYAVLRGSEAGARGTGEAAENLGRTYLVTGHYDSRNTNVLDTHGFAPGGNDDSSGVAVSLASARALCRLKPHASIVFAAVAGEEQGLIGSRHLAQVAKRQGWRLEGVLNDDIVGGDTTPGEKLNDKQRVRVFSEGIPITASEDEVKAIAAAGNESDSPSRELARSMLDVAHTYTLASGFGPMLEFRRDRFLRGGDHTSFNLEGFSAVRITEWRENYAHQHNNVRTENGQEYGDLVKYVDMNYVTNVARLNAATLATLALAPDTPANVKVVTARLDNSTELHWDASATPGAGYQVLWRETDAPTWQRVLMVKDIRVVLPVSKDNVFFGVRAVDDKGHAGMVVTPSIEAPASNGTFFDVRSVKGKGDAGSAAAPK